MPPASLPAPTNPRAAALVSRHGNHLSFLQAYNPSQQVLCLRYPSRAYIGNAPTLGLVKQAFGRDVAEVWVETQLFDLSEYAGVKEKLSLNQLSECALIILEKYGFMKVTELMLFFQYLKNGKYGRFYGSVDPMLILSSLQEFANQRPEEIAAHSRACASVDSSKAEIFVKPKDWRERHGYHPDMPMSQISKLDQTLSPAPETGVSDNEYLPNKKDERI